MNAARTRSGAHRAAGLTLVELLLALALSLLLMAGVATLFAASKRTYRLQEAAARVHENGRHAVNLLLRELRGAGYAGCASAPARPLVNQFSATYPLDDAHLSLPVDGFEHTGAGSWAPPLSARFPAGDAPAPTRGDVLTLRGARGAAARVVGHADAGSPLQTVGYDDVRADGPVLVADCRDVSVFAAAGDPHATGGVVGHDLGDLGKSYAGGELVPLGATSYFVRDGSWGEPALFRRRFGGQTAEELVEGIEDLQVLYGLDRDDDGAPDEYLTAQAVVAAVAWPRVRSVRVAVMARSRPGVVDPPQTYTPLATGSTDRPAPTTGAAGRLRHPFVATVALRNRLP
ncbi:MAG: PilW family protein [Gammaproteobacteria bacterium]